MDVLLAVGLGVEHNTIVAIIILGTRVDGNFKSTGGTRISVEFVDKLIFVGLFDLLDRCNAVSFVASSSAIFELDAVRCVLVAKNLVWLSGRIH